MQHSFVIKRITASLKYEFNVFLLVDKTMYSARMQEQQKRLLKH